MTQFELRAALYKGFSVLFNEPKKNGELNTDFLNEFITLMGQYNTVFLESSGKLFEAYNSLSYDDLLLEYSRIFLGPFQVLVPPYGSHYLDSSKLLNQESTAEVQNFYKDFEMDLSESFNDLPDHIVAELEFIYLLLYNIRKFQSDVTNHRANHHYKALKDFFFKYFYIFATSLSADIINKTNSVFYKEVAKIFHQFVHHEKEMVLSSKC